MDEPRWLLREEVEVIHFEMIEEHGGLTEFVAMTLLSRLWPDLATSSPTGPM